MIQGDLVKVTADAIVHPTNDSYYMGGEVGELSVYDICQIPDI